MYLALAIGAYLAWNIGANDVSNAMGTSVGSKAIVLKKAMIFAALADFAGAFLVGSNVSTTVRGKIVDPSFFAGDWQIYVIGMLAALLTAAIWTNISTFYGWPTSTTHSLIGSVFAFGFLTKGAEAVKWNVIGNIFSGWLLSPILGGACAALTFIVILRLILFAKSPITAAKRWIPRIIWITATILLLSLFANGLKGLNLPMEHWQTASIAVIGGLLAFYFASRWMQNLRYFDETTPLSQRFKVVEGIFAKMQLVSAFYVAFAHGSNDVANAVGPVAGIVQVAQTGALDVNMPIAKWILIFGAIFIALGTGTWGYRVIETIGQNITGISPTRGFSAEFGAATTVLVAAQLGLPVSTSHTIVGAVVGVGLVRGMRALNMAEIKKVLLCWLYTIPFSATLTIIIFYIVKAIIM
jgi:PiT family inorganic phosphate transporter